MIENRFMSIPDFTPDSPADAKPFFSTAAGEDGNFAVPVEDRFAKFKEIAEQMVIDAATKAMAQSGTEPNDFKRIIIASSTGFLAPGLETILVEKLGFSRDAHMSFLGFMGCAASVSGIRAATEFCRSEPGEKALVLAIDLASPHASFGGGINEAVLHAIFADGAAAIVLTGVKRSEVKAGQVTIDGHFSRLFEGTLHGILLSPCVMFVLEKFMADAAAARMRGDTNNTTGLCFSFAPGVRVEGILLEFHGHDAEAVAAPQTAAPRAASGAVDSAPSGASTPVPASVWPSFVPSAALAAYFAASTKLDRVDSVSAGLAVASVAGLSLLTRVAMAASPSAPRKSESSTAPWVAAGLAAAVIAASYAAGAARK